LSFLSFAITHLVFADGQAVACERCRLLNSKIFHDASLETTERYSEFIAQTDGDLNKTGSQATAQFVAYAGWPQSGAGQPVTLKYSYANMFDAGIKMPDEQPMPNWLIRGSVEEALRLWSEVVPIHFVEVPDSGQIQPDFRFRHEFINGPDRPPPADPWAKAQATCIGYGVACEVQYDNGDRWQESGTLPQPDLLGASIHEIGHILGLYHSSIPGVNMYWIFHRFQGLGTGQLFDDDINGVRSLYGAGVGSVTPLSIPEPDALALFFLAGAGWLLRRPFWRAIH
jgi:hypothetical protein